MPESKTVGNITSGQQPTIDTVLTEDSISENQYQYQYQHRISDNLNHDDINSPKSSPTSDVSRKSSYKSPYGIGKSGSTAEITKSNDREKESCEPSPPPVASPKPDLRHNIFGKFSSLLNKSVTRSRENSLSDETFSSDLKSTSSISLSGEDLKPKSNSSGYIKVKETNYVYLEYDPITKRKILNTYEILREIGKGEHGKVKLAKDLINNELVAIKIVNRKSKRDRPFLRNKNSVSTKAKINEYELKIKREIAIMKKCNHKHIVKLIEVLDDLHSYKIYLVLEYLEKGEIRWKRTKSDKLPTNQDEIPCCGSRRKPLNSLLSDDLQMSLLSNQYSPNLTFKQSRKIFRDVVLGLEYLHLQGIVHRDIKPANLLVSSENVVKISDFGVSFASSLSGNENGDLIDELELAKTAGTPAFFAPELCHTNFSRSNSTSESLSSLELLKNSDLSTKKVVSKINHKIDIWALGVTLYCLLFGKVPFNADSEFELFKVIVNQDVEYPASISDINSSGVIAPQEFALAKDLLSKLLDKNSKTRIDIKAIKQHPFTLMDLEDNFEQLNEFLHLNETGYNLFDNGLLDYNVNDDSRNEVVTQDEINNAVVAVGTSYRHSLIQAIKAGGKDKDIRQKFLSLQLEHSRSASSEESSNNNSQFNSSLRLNSNYSAMSPDICQQSSTPIYTPSHLSQQQASSSSTPLMPPPHKSSTLSIAGIREGRHSNPLMQDVIDLSASSSRRGSVNEALQIETKRNVGGDLYLKNQSAVDTFKGIQQQDDKRRKSSVLSTRISSPSAPSTPKNSVSFQPGEPPFAYNSNQNTITAPIPVPSKNLTPFHTRFGGLTISNERRPSSVMSLPLNESFASLDSFDDEYLTYKFEESKKESKNRRNSVVSQSESNLVEDNHIHHINKKFETFDFYNSMQNTGVPKNQESIGPTIMNTSESTSSSSSSSESSEDDEGNLTLAFTSKLAPPIRPQFLTLENRSISHDSNLPDLISNLKNTQVYDVPIVFQKDIPQFEDVPVGLLSPIPAIKHSNAPTSNGSNSTVTITENTGVAINPKDSLKLPSENLKQLPKSHKKSPLATHVTSSHEEESQEMESINQILLEKQSDSKTRLENYQFNKVKFAEDDNKLFKQAAGQNRIDKMPEYQRSKSITVGILQHNREKDDYFTSQN